MEHQSQVHVLEEEMEKLACVTDAVVSGISCSVIYARAQGNEYIVNKS